MLLGENNHGLVKGADVIQAPFLRAFSLVMNNLRFREVVVFEARLFDPVGQVNIFAIHEKRFVEQSGPVEGATAHKHETAHQHIHRIGLIHGQMAEVVLVEPLAPREKSR